MEGLIYLAFWGALYFLPSIIAYSRKHRNAGAITVLNLFLGWTLIGWIIAIVWSATSTRPTKVDVVAVEGVNADIIARAVAAALVAHDARVSEPKPLPAWYEDKEL